MNTLIELYDERAIENVLGPEVFTPKKVIYLCPTEIAQDHIYQQKLREYFAHRGLTMELDFRESSLFKTDKILHQLEKILATHTDIALDITGGTDAALFACGMFCQKNQIPAFTYSRKKNRFYDICYAPFADDLSCDIVYQVEDFFRMTGGSMREGRVDNHILSRFMDKYDPFFRVFLKHRRSWVSDITFFQRISRSEHGVLPKLTVEGDYYQKGDRGGRIPANEALLADLTEIGFLKDVKIHDQESLEFTFTSQQARAWLRDVGSVLELYMYKACVDADIFHDIVNSAIVDWDGTISHDSVSNEIDVVASRGCIPLFISCKTCEVKTEALNELAILRDRFGGKGAKAIIATTETCNAAARHRAAQLGIAVIDVEELTAGHAADRLKVVMKVIEEIKIE